MGCGFSTRGRNPIKGAGCIFTDGNLVIAGYQPNKIRPIISGLGGSKLKCEDVLETAHREFLEEMFGFEKNVLSKLHFHMQKHFTPQCIFANGNYMNFVYSFEDLVKMLHLFQSFSIQSKFYDKFPQTISELIFNRKNLVDAEVQQIVLLPLVKNIVISPDFVNDINLMLAKFTRKSV